MPIRTKRTHLPGAAITLIAGLGITPAWAANDVGQAVQDMGGSELLVRAANAIFSTCAALDGTTNKTSDQVALNLRCADMSQQALFLDPTPGNPAIPAADVFGLGDLGTAGIQQYFALLQQFTGEEASTQGRYATEGTVSQFKGIGARLSAIRRGARGNGLAFNLQGNEVFQVGDASSDASDRSSLIGGAAGEGDSDLGWAWFANVEYGFGDRDSSSNEDGYDADSWGGVIGADYAFNERFVAGVAFAFNNADIDFDQQVRSGVDSVSGGYVDTRSRSLSGFVNFTDGAMYASLIVNYGWTDIDMRRTINVSLASSGGASGGQAATFVNADSGTDGDQFGAEGQFGYTFGEGASNWDLYGGLSWLEMDIDSFSETGTPLGLTFGKQNIDSVQAFVGASFRHAVSTSVGVLVPYVTLEGRYEFENDSRSLSARYTLSPRAPGDTSFQGEDDDFDLPTDQADDLYFDASAGVSAQFGNNLAMFLQGSTLLGLKNTSSSLITLGIRGTF
ncbi:MAG: autotransporter outer membrane beta-barrel domain-containing protein [Pseudomonadales bacterium]|nr:autotransporter outer membrane beta-barrel domain-containing protein [Pseudomonadales bacterium]